MNFNWTSFLLGFAIGLWLALVVLLLMPQQDQQPCCGMPVAAQAGVGSSHHSHAWTIWIPGGSAVYRCTNNDHGGAIVEDHGGAIVDDHGAPIVDDHGAPIVDDHGVPIVDDKGGGNIPANAPNVPAPTSDLLGGDRGYRDFYCDTNQYGGAVVKSETGRVVAVGMPAGDHSCVSVNGNATAQDTDGTTIELDHGGAIVDDAGNATGPGGDLVYCMVAKDTSEAVVVNADGVPQ